MAIPKTTPLSVTRSVALSYSPFVSPYPPSPPPYISSHLTSPHLTPQIFSPIPRRRHGSTFTWTRHPAFPTRFLEHTPRQPVPNQRPVKDYLVPPLLLDLDAEECPAVRPFDPAVDDPQQARAWDCDGPIKTRWREMMRGSKREARQAAKQTRLVVYGHDRARRHWKVGGVDLVVLAMRGVEGLGGEKMGEVDESQLQSQPQSQSHLDRVLRLNGVPRILLNNETPQLLGFIHALYKQPCHTDNISPTASWPWEPNRASMQELRRLVALLARSQFPEEQLVMILPRVLRQAVRSLEAMIEGRDDFLLANSLETVCGLQARWGTSIPQQERRALAKVGLRAAAGTLNGQALGHQLALAEGAGLWDVQGSETDGAGDVVGQVLTNIETALRGLELTKKASPISPTDRHELIEVLTGVALDGKQDNSLHLGIRHYLYTSSPDVNARATGRDPNAFAAYVRVLVNLGAFRTVLFECRTCPADRKKEQAQTAINSLAEAGKPAYVGSTSASALDLTLEHAVEADVKGSGCGPNEGVALLQTLLQMQQETA